MNASRDSYYRRSWNSASEIIDKIFYDEVSIILCYLNLIFPQAYCDNMPYGVVITTQLSSRVLLSDLSGEPYERSSQSLIVNIQDNLLYLHY